MLGLGVWGAVVSVLELRMTWARVSVVWFNWSWKIIVLFGWLASIIFMHIVDFDSDFLVILTRNDAQQKFNCSVISLDM